MTTPMFEQYHALKSRHPDAILMFRMGDFYEMFFDDAVVAAPILDLALTSRNKSDPDPIPMAGVPHHAVEGYVQRLVQAGHRVAMADQVEDAAQAKGLVKREIVRVVTPGLVLNPTAIEAAESHYLAGIHRHDDRWGLAFLDASTGEFRCTEVSSLDQVPVEMARYEPQEVVLSPALEASEVLSKARKLPVGPLSDEAWEPQASAKAIDHVLGTGACARFGFTSAPASQGAVGAVLRYAMETLGSLEHLHGIERYGVEAHLVLDDATRTNLELTHTLRGGKRSGSLLWLIDKTATGMGSRKVRAWLSSPLIDLGDIGLRHAAVQVLVEGPTVRERVRHQLRQVSDMERLCTRVSSGTAHARDLDALRVSLEALPEILHSISGIQALKNMGLEDLCEDVRQDIARTLVETPPLATTEGGLIHEGLHEELDELTSLAMEGATILNTIEAREREATGIATLKIKRNRVFGYFLEVTQAHLHKVPERFFRKQTLSNCERFITVELKDLEGRLLGADERRKTLEYQLFCELRDRVAQCSTRLLKLAGQVATLDALGGLAETASRYGWIRPELTDDPILDIEGGRHPVVERAMEEERFVPNDLKMDTLGRQMLILTGPNMSGKSTTMRQVALISILAQMGSFVPAKRAIIGTCDRIFTRVGASDDLARGQSTFMVEMAETASILHQATARSLVLLDEIGRGTSTYDGLAIAWAVAEDLNERIGCRTLFATHYHELCQLAETHKGVVNLSVAVSEHGDSIVFLRRLKEGGTSRSYGIQCARIAGLPEDVITRAKTLLAALESRGLRNEQGQLSLFGDPNQNDNPHAVPEAPKPANHELLGMLQDARPDEMTPREALDFLYKITSLPNLK